MAGKGNCGRKGQSKLNQEATDAIVGGVAKADFTVRMPQRVRRIKASRDLWNSVVNEMVGTLQDKDAYSLEVMCCLFAEVRKLGDFIHKNGHTVEYISDRKTANMSKRPEVDILRNLRSELSSLMVQFGLTPRSGQQLRAPQGIHNPTPADNMQERYGRNRG